MNIQKIVLGGVLLTLALVVAKLIKGLLGLVIAVGLAVLSIRTMIQATRQDR
jgi:uncharacterized membrane protein YccF (DUF307 family)